MLLCMVYTVCAVCFFGFSSSGTFPQPLSKEEEMRVLQMLQNGTVEQKQQAQDSLVLHNLRLVAHIAKKYQTPQKDMEELISIGTVGLIKAIQTYDTEKKIRLASYAARCIENEILMHLRANKKTQNEISLYEPIGTDRDGNEIVMLDIINIEVPDFATALDTRIETRKMKEAILQTLSNRERYVICLRYGLGNQDPLTQQEIAKKLGISRSYVSRIEKKALQKLQNALSAFQG